MNLLKYLFIYFIILSAGHYSYGQVMISQYIETNSGATPKGIEIFNYSGSIIDFSITPLEVWQGTNGGACGSPITINSGILNPNKVWVIGTSDLTTFASAGPDNDGTTTNGFAFNGDDALQLYLGGTLMDVFGTCGTDPGSSWSGGGVSTSDQNIAIKSGICTGTTSNWSDPSIRFDAIDIGSNMTGFGTAPTCSYNTISTNTVSSTNFTVDCTTSATGTVDFSSVGTFAAGNIFTAEISDASGSFASPTVIGTFAASGVDPTGTISFTIPADFISGTGYRIRVIADNPTTYGTNNGIDISINNTSPCTPTSPTSGGLLINEFSNGPSGNKEYYEFIVAGKCGDVIDVSGYIIDDNNGTFSNPSTYPGGSGIATGYLQLTNHSQWTAIPVGSVIVVFNANDRNPLIPVDDPYDSNNDSLYVIPHNNASLFTIRNDIPNANLSPDSSYFPTTSSSTVWSPLGIANAGDAVQVRQPNGNYFFGVSYGNSDITGGPDNTKISNSNLGGNNGYFSNGDFRDIANWSIGNAGTDETPGTYNNALNEAWLRAMRDPNTATCPITPLPIELLTFEGVYKDNQVNLYWESATELNNDFYSVNHSTDGFNFAEIGIKQGAGTSSSTRTYDMIHRHPSSGINYYQLISSDFDGTQYDKGIISVLVDQDRIFYDQLTQQILFPENGNYTMYSSSGQKIAELKNQSQYPFSIAGIYHIYNHKTGIVTKIAIQ